MRHQYCKSLARSVARPSGPALMQLFCAAGCTAKTNGAHTHTEETCEWLHTCGNTHKEPHLSKNKSSFHAQSTRMHEISWITSHYHSHASASTSSPCSHFYLSCKTTMDKHRKWIQLTVQRQRQGSAPPQSSDWDALDWKSIMGIPLGSEWFSRCASR